MNAGLSNLATLKAHLLPEAIREEVAYDQPVLRVGLGVAALVEKFLGRRLGRVVGDMAEFTKDRIVIILPRYPLEAITAVHERRRFVDPWTALDLNSTLESVGNDCGTIYLAETDLDSRARLRVTWTGGYWWETAEPYEAGYPTAQPVGSYVLPSDILAAWLLQCSEMWARQDPLAQGTGTRDTSDVKTNLTELDLIPQVIGILNPHRRYA